MYECNDGLELNQNAHKYSVFYSSFVCNVALQTRFRLRPTTVLVQKENTSDDTNRREGEERYRGV